MMISNFKKQKIVLTLEKEMYERSYNLNAFENWLDHSYYGNVKKGKIGVTPEIVKELIKKVYIETRLMFDFDIDRNSYLN